MREGKKRKAKKEKKGSLGMILILAQTNKSKGEKGEQRIETKTYLGIRARQVKTHSWNQSHALKEKIK